MYIVTKKKWEAIKIFVMFHFIWYDTMNSPVSDRKNNIEQSNELTWNKIRLYDPFCPKKLLFNWRIKELKKIHF